MRIIFLGTGGSIPTKERGLPAIIIEYLNQLYLFDCGEGTLRQIMKFSTKNDKLNFMNIDNIFITHFHADHILGLGGLIHSMNFLERKKNLNIYGCKGIKDAIEKILMIETKNFTSINLKNFNINIYEINSDSLILEEEKFKIYAFKTEHSKESFGYVFEEKEKRKFLKEKALALGIPEGHLYSKLQNGKTINFNGKIITPDDVLSEPIKGRKIVYTGDTAPCENVVKFSKDADVLICDSTYFHQDIDKISDHLHSTSLQAAEMALKANVKALYLIHISQRYKDSKILEEEAKKIFKNTYITKDFLTVKITPPPEKEILNIEKNKINY